MVLRPCIRWCFIVLLALLTAKVYSQEPPKLDVVYITAGQCGIMPDGKLYANEAEKAQTVSQPCQIWEDAKDSNVRYVLVGDSEGNLQRVLQLRRDTMEQKEIWKRPNGKSI